MTDALDEVVDDLESELLPTSLDYWSIAQEESHPLRFSGKATLRACACVGALLVGVLLGWAAVHLAFEVWSLTPR